MPYRQRSFGWIQDAGDIFKLRSIAEIFVLDSELNRKLRLELIPNLVPQHLGRDAFILELGLEPIEIPYQHLKGKGPQPGETRANASCSGIAQAVLPAQNGRPYSSDWATESYIRFAVSVGILDYDRNADSCKLSENGLRLVQTQEGSNEEKRVLGDILLSYPPACRILQLLNDNNGSPMSKYSIGQKLGFIGEKGFSSYPEYMISEALYFGDQAERRRIKANVEGTNDKYARMICGWLKQLSWVSKTNFHVPVIVGNRPIGDVLMTGYRITLNGVQALNKSKGNSSHQRIPKIVRFEMLATAEPNARILRHRRARIINQIKSESLSVDDLDERLEFDVFCWAPPSTIKDDINGLRNIGLNIKEANGKYKIEDSIVGLSIPNEDEEIRPEQDDETDSIKSDLRLRLMNVDHRYLSLIDYAFDPQSSLLFEVMTIDLLHQELGLNAMHLGHSNRPDGILSINDHGVIIDNKAYSQGFSIPAGQRREMKDYIDQNQQRNPAINSTRWWENFPEDINVFSYLFVSSYFCGQFQESMNILKAQTNTNGAVISAKNLLLLAEKLKNHLLSDNDFVSMLNSNAEVIID